MLESECGSGELRKDCTDDDEMSEICVTTSDGQNGCEDGVCTMGTPLEMGMTLHAVRGGAFGSSVMR